MNLDAKNSDPSSKKETAKADRKKLSRKEKKAAKKEAVPPHPPAPNAAPEPKAKPTPPPPVTSEEVEARLEPAQPKPIPPPKYTLWEKISPPARRKRQLANMESGFREVLGLVQAMRSNQEVLLESFKKLPEAVDSVKKLADHSATQSDILKAMNDQLGSGSSVKFNETLASMDKTTQQLLERAQRSEERLYGMLRQAQRRIAFMTLLVLLLFVGAAAAVYRIAFSDSPLPWAQPENGAQTESSEPVPVSDEPVLPEEPVEEARPYQEPLPAETETTKSEDDETIADYIEEDLLTNEDDADPVVESDADPLEIAAPSLEDLGVTEAAEEPVTDESGD
ncbi:MAG: hypothetical protein WD490_06370 [Opitutales bacterium]